MNNDANWHLDKRVPVAIIVALIMQTSGMVWWAAQASERLNSVERTIAQAAPQADRLTRVEVKLEAVQDGITEIKAILRKEPIPAIKAR